LGTLGIDQLKRGRGSIRRAIVHEWKYFIGIPVVFALMLFGYWVKCQLAIDLDPLVSLSSYIPFKYLQRDDVVVSGGKGALLDESFDSRKIIPDWSELWAREKGKVTRSYDSGGIGGSRCLLIKSASKGSWSYAHRKLIEVKNGDVFGFTGFARIEDGHALAFAGVEALDKGRKVIGWNYVKEVIGRGDGWTRFQRRFTLPGQVKYIRFRLSGAGMGEFRFDDIRLWKERAPETDRSPASYERERKTLRKRG
jgi:hypothetical protein